MELFPKRITNVRKKVLVVAERFFNEVASLILTIHTKFQSAQLQSGEYLALMCHFLVLDTPLLKAMCLLPIRKSLHASVKDVGPRILACY